MRFDIDRNRLSDEQQIDRDRHVYKYRLYFKDMIGGRDHITISMRVDMTEFDQLYLPAQERPLSTRTLTPMPAPRKSAV